MSDAYASTVLAASRRERALYEELVGVYRGLAAALGDERFDRARVAAEQARAEAATTALRALAAELAPHRLTGAPLATETHALWQASAALAAEAVRLNGELAALARARQSAVAARLTTLDTGRQALAGYRPPTGLRAATVA